MILFIAMTGSLTFLKAEEDGISCSTLLTLNFPFENVETPDPLRATVGESMELLLNVESFTFLS